MAQAHKEIFTTIANSHRLTLDVAELSIMDKWHELATNRQQDDVTMILLEMAKNL